MTAVEVEHATIGAVTLTWARRPAPGHRVVYVSGSGSDLRQAPSVFDGTFAQPDTPASPFDLVAYDHRGLGRSSPGPSEPTMADFAGDLLGLMDHLGWATCRAIGVSFGGMVLMHAAATAPERFERLVLACTSPGGHGGSSFPLHTLIDMDPAERRRRWVDILDVRNRDPRRHAAVLSIVASMDGPDGPQPHSDGEVAQLLARAGHDCWDRLGRLTMPVFIAAGRHDGIAVPSNQEAMHERLPSSTLAWFDGGHAFFIEDPTAHPAMRAFIAH